MLYICGYDVYSSSSSSVAGKLSDAMQWMKEKIDKDELVLRKSPNLYI